MLVFHHFEDATFELKSQVLSEISSTNGLPVLLFELFRILGVGQTNEVKFELDLEKFDFTEYYIEGRFGAPVYSTPSF